MDFQNWDLREKDRRTFNPPSAPAIGVERRRNIDRRNSDSYCSAVLHKDQTVLCQLQNIEG